MTAATLHLNLPPETDSVTALLDALEEFTDAHELGVKPAARLLLLAEELAANVVMHAVGATHFAADLTLEGGVLHFTLADDGMAFDPLGQAAANVESPLEERDMGGLGVHLVRKLAATAHYRREGSRNILSLTLDAGAD